MNVESIAKSLPNASGSGLDWIASCPASGHGKRNGDRNPSLSLSERNGKVLVHCHAGCSQDAVIDALKSRGLWSNGARRKHNGSAQGTKPKLHPIIPVPADAPTPEFGRFELQLKGYGSPTWTFRYRLATGELAGFAARYDPLPGQPLDLQKEVRPITFCDLGNGVRDWRMKGIPAPRPLYRLSELLGRPDAPVLVCEGEKATEAAQLLFPDLAATTPMHGAKSPPQTDWLPMKGRDVVIWPDNDALAPASRTRWLSSPPLPGQHPLRSSTCRPRFPIAGTWPTTRPTAGPPSGCARSCWSRRCRGSRRPIPNPNRGRRKQ